MSEERTAAAGQPGTSRGWLRLNLGSALWLLAGSTLLAPVSAGAQTAIYYSVGTQAAALYSGNASAASGVLTLSSPAHYRVGVGDEIRVGADRHHITGRNSSTEFTIQDSAANGGTPGDTNITFGSTAISIFRAFNLLSTAESSSSNGTHLATGNLVGGNYQLNWAMYNDGPMDDSGTGSPRTGILIDGYTTGAANYIRIFTPVLPNQVGVSQRHKGKAGTGFRLRPVSNAPDPSYFMIQVDNNHVRIEGIEIDGSGLTNTHLVYGIRVLPTAAAEIRLDKLIIHDISNAALNDDQGDLTCVNFGLNSGGVGTLSNSLCYAVHNFNTFPNGGTGTEIYGLRVGGSNTGTIYLYGNTVYDIDGGGWNDLQRVAGISRGGGPVIVKNTAVLDVTGVGPSPVGCYNGAFNAASSNNVSSDATQPVAGTVLNQTSYSSYFRSVVGGAEDLHLLDDSFAIWGANGADLTPDPTSGLSFPDDFDGEGRHATAPDIGADEFETVNYRSIGTAADFNGLAGDNITVTIGSTTVTKTAGAGWKASNRGRGDRLTVGANHYQIRSVNSDNQLTLATPAVAGYTGAYTIARQFTTLQGWENCVSRDTGPGAFPCSRNPAAGPEFFATATASLVADDRSEVGIAYNDSAVPANPDFTANLLIAGSTTDAGHTITLTADHGNRHYGIPGAGALVDQTGVNANPTIEIQDDYVTVEWLELNTTGEQGGIYTRFISAAGASNIVLRNNLVHGAPGAGFGITLDDGNVVSDVYNNIVYSQGNAIRVVSAALNAGAQIRIMNNTMYDYTQGFDSSVAPAGNPNRLTLINNLAADTDASAQGFILSGQLNLASRNNLSANTASTDPTAGVGTGVAPNIFASPGGGGVFNVHTTNDVDFVNAGVGNLHIMSSSVAVNTGLDLSTLFIADIDFGVRQTPWDIGADDQAATTEVKLSSFAAVPGDQSVLVVWRTASELSNLGFHLYRSLGENGPWTRLTSSLIPGLGSSAVGQAYSYGDSGLTNGTRYFYRLEDVDARSKTTSHGPVSAVPQAGAGTGSDPSSSGKNATKKASASSCPDWVLQAYGSAIGSDPSTLSLSCTRHGNPEAVSLGELSRDQRSATLELRTGGFYALHEPSGTVRVFVPGFDFPQQAEAAALPIRRVLADAVVGRQVLLGGVRALELSSFALQPSALGKAEMQVGRDGTVRALRRGDRQDATRGLRRFPKSELVTLLPSLFQGEKKSAVVEIAPLRFDATRRQLVLAKRVLVRLLFAGREAGESGRGSVGRAPRPRDTGRVSGEVLARLHTTSRGLYAAAFEQLFPGRTRGFALSELKLTRQGEAVGFHVEPAGSSFGPGGRLYFYADKTTGSTEYSGEVAYELSNATGGAQLGLLGAAPGTAPVASAPSVKRLFETNRLYQPGLLEAADQWLWEPAAQGVTRTKSVALTGVSGTGTASVDVYVQGASESGQAVDHHVSVSVNGTLVGEARAAGKKPFKVSASFAASLLREGANDVSLTNVGDTGVTSLVFLDRIEVTHPQQSALQAGSFEGTWNESGAATVSGVGGAVALLDLGTPTAGAPRWLTGYESSGGSVRFRAEAGRRYLATSLPLAPRVAVPEPSTLKSATNQADYILIAPRAFLAAAEPLLTRRADQGLTTRGVAFEEIAAQFGYGQASAEAIKSFLGYAYQSWSRPSPRYVVLLGDASYDPRNFVGTSPAAPLPALWTKTTYLWTVSDPLLAAVNGSDNLPDLAIGRLPAATVQQAEALVAKLVAWEDSGQGLAGAAALVADNPDLAGDFEADVEDIRASYLGGRDAQVLKLSELGVGMRPAIREALDSGLSHLDYVGHGGSAVWASENVWNIDDAASLQAQSRQPLLVTMNCLNGYFVAPTFESLTESLVKAQGRGAIAGFSPSGLSLDGPAHQYHRALMAELTSGRHERLGDAVAAAQKTYAETGLMPELLGIYHLFGDPATIIR